MICDYDVMSWNPNLFKFVLFSGVEKGKLWMIIHRVTYM